MYTHNKIVVRNPSKTEVAPDNPHAGGHSISYDSETSKIILSSYYRNFLLNKKRKKST